MTKRYAVQLVDRRHGMSTVTPRPPTYPERPIAFRSYPVGWWVAVPGLDFCGRVEYCDKRGVKIVDAALFGLESVVSCTARQVAALESRQ